MTEHPPISGRECSPCAVYNDAWRDFAVVRGVVNDRRLKPANLRHELARAMVYPQRLRGRGVPKILHKVDEWLAANQKRFPGLTIHGEPNRPELRLSAIDLRLLLGYASNVLDHASEVLEHGGDINAHFRRNASMLPRFSPETIVKIASSSDDEDRWGLLRASLSRRIVAHELKISERTIARRLEADPNFDGPSVFAWAAQYHLHSLNR